MQGAFIFGQFRPRSGLNINMQINRGEQIDYTNSRLGGPAALPAADRLERDAPLARAPALYVGSLEHARKAPTIFDAKLTDLRLTWQFNVRSFVRLTLQDQDIERNVDLYVNPLDGSEHRRRSRRSCCTRTS